MELPRADALGRVPYLMTIPAKAIRAGSYEIRANGDAGEHVGRFEHHHPLRGVGSAGRRWFGGPPSNRAIAGNRLGLTVSGKSAGAPLKGSRHGFSGAGDGPKGGPR